VDAAGPVGQLLPLLPVGAPFAWPFVLAAPDERLDSSVRDGPSGVSEGW
jgi:hypothetical protein